MTANAQALVTDDFHMSRNHEDDMDVENGRGGSGARVGGNGMQGPWNHSGPPGAGGTRRRSGRLPQEALVCNLGLVIDISIGGMKVLSRTPHNGSVKIKFRDYPNLGTLEATVTWSRRAGLLMREIGMRFENVTPAASSILTQIASMHRIKRVI